MTGPKVITTVPELCEAFDAKVEAGGDQLDVPLLEGVVDHALVLLGQDGAGGVDLKWKVRNLKMFSGKFFDDNGIKLISKTSNV